MSGTELVKGRTRRGWGRLCRVLWATGRHGFLLPGRWETQRAMGRMSRQDLTQILTGPLWLPKEDRRRWGEGTRAEGEPRRDSDPGYQHQACSQDTSVGAPSVSPALADYLYLFIWPCNLWDLSSLTEDRTHAPCTESVES